MQPRKRLLVVTAMIAALAVLAPSAAVASEGGSHSRALHITKECSQFTGRPGSFCTITSSNLKAIKVGSKVVYAQAPGAASIDSDVYLVVSPGDVAFGHISLDFGTSLGVGTFSGGTGKFTDFHARFVITDHPLPTGTGLTDWDGRYSFGRHDGDQDARIAENTFTKWRTAEPPVAPVLINMAGVVGGDVGRGTFAGEVVGYTPGATTVIEALYHFKGSRHSFTASVHVEQTGLNAVIIGVVTDGWLKGGLVQAGYTQITCDHDGISTTCFRGWLDIVQRSRHED
jgi:hypothetical protein